MRRVNVSRLRTYEQRLSFFVRQDNVVVDDFLDLYPFLESLFTNLFLACLAQVFNFSLLRIAFEAEVVELNEHLEGVGQLFSAVLPYVLWTQLHLAGSNVVAPLYERCVELDSTEF